MAWTITPTAGSSFQTLDSLREHLKESVENPQDEEEGPDNVDCLFPADEITKPKRKPRVTKTKKQSPPKSEEDSACLKPKRTPKMASKEISSSDEEDDCGTSPQPSCPRNSFENIQNQEKDFCEEQDISTDVDEFTDLTVAVTEITKALKAITVKVTAVSSVLSDVQAASVTRTYTSLQKAVNNLSDLANCGKSLTTRSKRKAAPKKR
ncbi:viral late transcription factor [Pteropox virus]|uniref:Viral late transcription factor n=1 Tax=Pteropox virus TaxID=1873698 RepID=A0A1B1MRI4_9POXV|nr:viral late transcription factor [Pteropox virus]ANS71163.1 viral late transcription factor [Pteropox virus]